MLGGVPAWLPLSLFALVVWTVQRLLSELALTDLGTRKFYLLSAAVSLVTYAPFLAARPPALTDLPPALGLACLMAMTFGVITEAVRRGPLGAVSPVTALSPTLTGGARGDAARRETGLAGVPRHHTGRVRDRAAELAASSHRGRVGWLWLAVLSLALQGIGAFVAKLVVTPAGPSGLLLASAGVQVVAGLVMAPP